MLHRGTAAKLQTFLRASRFLLLTSQRGYAIINDTSLVHRGTSVRRIGNFWPVGGVQREKGTVNPDDQRLIAECLQGRSAAFGELVRRYQDRLFNTVHRLVGNAEDAQDVVQDAFIHAYQSLRSFKGDSQFFTWLYRIAVNTAISLKRKQRVVYSLRGGHAEDGGSEPIDHSEFSRPEHALEKTEQVRRIQEALHRLSPEHRTVLVMKDIDGQKYEAMAEVLDVPIGTIRSRLHRARIELRDILERMGE
jgi:RNA polymerase sigma-70 factor, ECF subfamily